MANKVSREDVNAAINSERDYQDQVVGNKYGLDVHPVAAEVLMIESYAARAREAWTNNKSDAEALNAVRKVAGLCVRCMENHGAPLRVF